MRVIFTCISEIFLNSLHENEHCIMEIDFTMREFERDFAESNHTR